MSIEEAEYILNEAVINQPSINSYTYISAEEINLAIDKILEERVANKNKIKELEKQIIEERIKLEIIKEKEIEKYKYPDKVETKNNAILKNIIKYVKKTVKPLFLLEN